jgi:hypothetical protein
MLIVTICWLTVRFLCDYVEDPSLRTSLILGFLGSREDAIEASWTLDPPVKGEILLNELL